jgi:hypothetical protein
MVLGTIFGKVFGGGKGEAAPATDTSAQDTATPDATAALSDANQGQAFTPIINPLAMNLYWATNIAPMMSATANDLEKQSQAWNQNAQANIDKYQMPEQYKALFGQMLPSMGQDQTKLLNALRAASVTAPAMDLFQNQINDYSTRLAQYYGALQSQAAASSNDQLATLIDRKQHPENYNSDGTHK